MKLASEEKKKDTEPHVEDVPRNATDEDADDEYHSVCSYPNTSPPSPSSRVVTKSDIIPIYHFVVVVVVALLKVREEG